MVRERQQMGTLLILGEACEMPRVADQLRVAKRYAPSVTCVINREGRDIDGRVRMGDHEHLFPGHSPFGGEMPKGITFARTGRSPNEDERVLLRHPHGIRLGIAQEIILKTVRCSQRPFPQGIGKLHKPRLRIPRRVQGD